MRAFGVLLFLAIVGGIAWFILQAEVPGADVGTDAGPTELDVAEDAAGELGDLDAALADALGNARRARDVARELDEAAAEARQAATRMDALAVDNDAAAPSARAMRMAADDAEEAAMLMRRYAETLLGRFEAAGDATEDAEAIADVAIEVEETQAEAARAAAAARVAREEMERIAVGADNRDDRRDGEPGAYEAGPLEDLRGDIVIIDEREQREEADDVEQRLDAIFPDDVLDYDDGEVPYGERG